MMPRKLLVPLALGFGVLACTAETDLGERSATTSATLPAEGETCTCGPRESCCGPSMTCDPCSAHPSGGTTCGVSNGVPDRRCRPKRPEGTLCDFDEQCEDGTTCEAGDTSDPRKSCAKTASGRCRESLDCPRGNVCVDSHCKLAAGEPCTATWECASNRCFSSSGLDYRCM